jgi:hypothetical protein
MTDARTSGPRANALDREIVTRATRATSAPAEAVWAVLTDLSTHQVWGGTRQKKGGLLSIDGGTTAPTVGTEFTSTGGDRMCEMRDRSVVTEATAPRVFEFVTESAMTLRKGGQRSDWTLVHRYEIEPTAAGATVTTVTRVTRASDLPGALKVYRTPVLRWFAQKESEGVTKRGLANLLAMAEERANAR